MQKLYYSISEVSKIVGEPQHVLRYWEKEFPLLRPKKNRAGNRIYSEKDLKMVLTIKSLLREQKLSPKGALEELYKIFEVPIKSNQISAQKKVKPKGSIKKNELSLFNLDTTNKIILKEIRKKLNVIMEIAKNL
ncbi:MAG: MerR family transcriptional regulator [Candidatus Kapaibacteriota bacterium]